MMIYSVGVDELSGYDMDEIAKNGKFQWLVYWYEAIDSYCGHGEAVGLSHDGMLYTQDLSHCSCNGPLEGFGWSPKQVLCSCFRIV